MLRHYSPASFDFEERLPDGSRVKRRAAGKAVSPTGEACVVDTDGRVYASTPNSPLQLVRVPDWEDVSDDDGTVPPAVT